LGIEDITAVYKNLRDGADIDIKRMA